MSANEVDRNKVTKAHIQAAVTADLGNNVSVISWTFDDSVSVKGDGATSYITSINVNYSISNKTYETNYVVKIMPSTRYVHGISVSGLSQLLFKIEDLFYKQLVPLLNQQLNAIEHQSLRVPKLLFSINSEDCQFLIMENMKISGFSRRDKSLSLDVPHTKLVVQELGRYHAASLLVESSLGNKIQDEYLVFKGDEWSEQLKGLGDWMNNILEDARSLAKKEGSKYDGVLSWVEEAQKTGMDLIEHSLQDPAAQFSVLGHGDFKSRNLMFAYTKDGEPEDVRMYDFQGSRKISVAVDLNLLLYTSMSGTDRKAHRQEILSLYYNSFSGILRGSGQTPFTLQQLDDECRRKMVHGVLFGIISIKSATGNYNEEKVRQSYLDIFDEMIQFGIAA